MSRIGKQPIDVPSGVNVEIKGDVVKISGKKGTVEKHIPSDITIVKEGNVLNIKRKNDENEVRAKHGLVRSLVHNMVEGVSKGYTKELLVVGVGFKAQVRAGGILGITPGFSHPIEFFLPQGITAKVDAGTKIILEGCDKELLGEIAAQIRKLREPEPYKGKGIKYADEIIKKKAGKAAAAAGAK
jgi:large subunit ribosomal protein L6